MTHPKPAETPSDEQRETLQKAIGNLAAFIRQSPSPRHFCPGTMLEIISDELQRLTRERDELSEKLEQAWTRLGIDNDFEDKCDRLARERDEAMAEIDNEQVHRVEAELVTKLGARIQDQDREITRLRTALEQFLAQWNKGPTEGCYRGPSAELDGLRAVLTPPTEQTKS